MSLNPIDCDRLLRIAHLKKTYGFTDAQAEGWVWTLPPQALLQHLACVLRKHKSNSIVERLREVVRKARREGKLDKIEHNDHDSQGCATS